MDSHERQFRGKSHHRVVKFMYVEKENGRERRLGIHCKAKSDIRLAQRPEREDAARVASSPWGKGKLVLFQNWWTRDTHVHLKFQGERRRLVEKKSLIPTRGQRGNRVQQGFNEEENSRETRSSRLKSWKKPYLNIIV